MSGVNKVILIGNLGKDPEVRHLESGATVANFPLATSETYRDRSTGEKKTITEWHNIVLWRGLAEISEKYLKKGNQVYIEGRISTRSYEDKEGVKKYITEVVGQNMTMLGGKSSSDSSSSDNNNYQSSQSNANSGNANEQASVPAMGDDIDDLPF